MANCYDHDSHMSSRLRSRWRRSPRCFLPSRRTPPWCSRFRSCCRNRSRGRWETYYWQLLHNLLKRSLIYVSLLSHRNNPPYLMTLNRLTFCFGFLLSPAAAAAMETKAKAATKAIMLNFMLRLVVEAVWRNERFEQLIYLPNSTMKYTTIIISRFLHNNKHLQNMGRSHYY